MRRLFTAVLTAMLIAGLGILGASFLLLWACDAAQSDISQAMALAVVALLDVLVYRNSHLYLQSQKIDDPQSKIAILSRASSVFPCNDLIFYELGKAYFDIGTGNLDNKNLSQKAFRDSLASFKRSLALNPSSYFCHFSLARSLDYLSFSDPASGKEAFEEFRDKTG